jgi:hypothetical protein
MNDGVRRVVNRVLGRFRDPLPPQPAPKKGTGDEEIFETPPRPPFPSILRTTRRFEALLRDVLPDHPCEVAVLVESVHSGLAEQVQQQATGIIPEPIHQEWVQQLEDQAGIAPRFAIWVVDSWCEIFFAEDEVSGEARVRNARQTIATVVSERAGTLDAVLRGVAPHGAPGGES